jgi:hypothetical protein
MNFYGDSFHVTKLDWTRPGYTYTWSYGPADPNRLVVNTPSVNQELGKVPGKNYTYLPLQVNLGAFQTPFDASSPCPGVIAQPPNDQVPWPSLTNNCADINGAAITAATNGGQVGFMHLNGKRLSNLGAIEAMPNAAIIAFQRAQSWLGAAAGEILWNSGSRGGIGAQGGETKLSCTTAGLTDCYIGRFGWLGDRVSLEDQVANAAFVEMNITTTQGYNTLYPKGNVMFPIRYNFPNCGPADLKCTQSAGNSDLAELDVNRMAEYARWLGDPTRSEFTVSLPEVVDGEKIFMRLSCNLCHVITKIQLGNRDAFGNPDPTLNDTMLNLAFRGRIATHVAPPAYPFISYLGTDLLMHDMGYLSQVGIINSGALASGIRNPTTGVVLPQYKNYVQKIRTPPLKGLRFNRFVTDSRRNTIAANPPNPACDFLLHDGRACDAIEAAFLHDGPAIKALNVIGGLNGLSPTDLQHLRAFLYSL